jgi:caa(3)-type oxidase subunit IV
MHTNEHIDYKAQRLGYYKVLVGLLLLTTVTFIQPHMFLENYTFVTQISIGAIKAWLILMYYMHMKGEKLIGWTVVFSVSLVVVFFAIVIADAGSFQYKNDSHITSQPHIEVNYHHEASQHDASHATTHEK